jgi:hypothetical protein
MQSRESGPDIRTFFPGAASAVKNDFTSARLPGDRFLQIGNSFVFGTGSREHTSADVRRPVENGKAHLDNQRTVQVFDHLVGLHQIVVGPRLGSTYNRPEEQSRKQEWQETSHATILRYFRLVAEWKAQFQQPFAMPFFREITDTSQQHIFERNHSHQFSAAALDDGHPCESGFRHAKDNYAQWLVGMSDNGVADKIAQ